ncbi:phasin family protein [Aliiroseovarius sediminis]|uniref:phasin family protein n=1 Tax=Aliiroseovarius sediminis TaxID=2925839 RepID=UPI001F5A7484|nr:phasin family protein [Aliiroseovarius sediminis]MCI2393912.1 phasin family protein [Aliiroseovarius sediminis]
MAQTKNNPAPDISAFTDMMKQTQDMMTANPMMGAQMTNVFETQQKFLQEAQTFSEHWFDRRKQAAETAMQAARDIVDAGSAEPSVVLNVMSEWQQHSMERMAADFQEWVDLCSRCAGQVNDSKSAKKK